MVSSQTPSEQYIASASRTLSAKADAICWVRADMHYLRTDAIHCDTGRKRGICKWLPLARGKMTTYSEDFASQAFRKHFAELVEAIQVLISCSSCMSCVWEISEREVSNRKKCQFCAPLATWLLCNFTCVEQSMKGEFSMDPRRKWSLYCMHIIVYWKQHMY